MTLNNISNSYKKLAEKAILNYPNFEEKYCSFPSNYQLSTDRINNFYGYGFLNLSYSFLNLFTEQELITSPGSLFHPFTTLLIKKCSI
ncbi:hypothetical protein BpHYR1_029311 [Brachionus plicatilis]|uniref:Uncharacterized protein n=1 Tax=Brachionus plicatilis TaxID=10195 RepID=A0A3M7PAQ5_BRAPC|nr:hypothetical protein BpHYR1_029311 [Brachionus plicatilis]